MVHLSRIFSEIKHFLFSHPLLYSLLYVPVQYCYCVTVKEIDLILNKWYIKICKKHTYNINVTNYILHCIGKLLIQYLIPTPSPNDSLHVYSKLSNSSRVFHIMSRHLFLL